MAWSVIAIFLVTMAVFLWIAYRSDRKSHSEATFAHLVETAAVLVPLVERQNGAELPDLSGLERRLSERTGMAHRLLIATADASISQSSVTSMLGRNVRTVLELDSDEGAEKWVGFATGPGGEWYVASLPIGGAGERLYLMRSRRGDAQFAKQFWAIHGVHVGVTVLLFLLLLSFLAERFVRRPIEQLSTHVERVQSGEFQTRPEIYSRDEFGWLAERFTEMGLRLRETVERLVRAEKSASAAAVAYRVAREVKEPLADLRRHLAYLEGLSGADEELLSVGHSLREDLRALVRAVVRLEGLMVASGADGEDSGRDRQRNERAEGA